MRALMIVALFASAAHAEPPGLVAASPYRLPQPALTPDEEQLIDDGYMPGGRIFGGVVLASAVGFGTGELVEGHYGVGLVFTAIDTAALAGIIATRGEVKGDVGIGNVWIAAMLVSRIVQIVDTSVYPVRYNRRVHDARLKAGMPGDDAMVTPFIAGDADRKVAGISLRF